MTQSPFTQVFDRQTLIDANTAFCIAMIRGGYAKLLDRGLVDQFEARRQVPEPEPEPKPALPASITGIKACGALNGARLPLPMTRMSVKELLVSVCEFYGVTPESVRGSGRTRWLVKARHHFWYLLAVKTDFSTPQMGIFTGGRDHTTVIAGIRRHCFIHYKPLPRYMTWGPQFERLIAERQAGEAAE
jgi:hypothetical protein